MASLRCRILGANPRLRQTFVRRPAEGSIQSGWFDVVSEASPLYARGRDSYR